MVLNFIRLEALASMLEALAMIHKRSGCAAPSTRLRMVSLSLRSPKEVLHTILDLVRPSCSPELRKSIQMVFFGDSAILRMKMASGQF